MIEYDINFNWKRASSKDKMKHCLSEFTWLLLLPLAYAIGTINGIKKKMSHNLYFSSATRGYVNFPIQLPTKISREIMNISNMYDRLYVIEIYLYGCKWSEDDIDAMILKLYRMMEDKDLTLEIT